MSEEKIFAPEENIDDLNSEPEVESSAPADNIPESEKALRKGERKRKKK